ncbi:MAG: hypothetical protein HY026_03190 [Deltaproteobacteria bacterium]|nr:hypothetical protein [Deltaproteobacteria bacterium]
MKKKGSPRKQPSIIKLLEFIAQNNGYIPTARKKDKAKRLADKKFLPDLVAKPYKGQSHTVFEVEKTVTNNTLYKSIASLLDTLRTGASHAYLVVPNKKLAFAEKCVKHMKSLITYFGKTGKGANPKVKLDVISFEDVSAYYAKIEKWVNNGRIGQPPKCSFLKRR